MQYLSMDMSMDISMAISIHISLDIYPPPCPRGTSGVFLGPWRFTNLPSCFCFFLFKGAQGSRVASAWVTLFGQFWTPVFSMLLGCPFSAFWTPTNAKRAPIGDNFRSLWGYRWKCENDGFVYTKPSFSWLEGVPRDPQSLPKSTSENNSKKLRKKHENYQKWVSKGTPLGDQRATKNRLFRDFFDLAPSGVPWEGPGSPNDSQGHQNDTEMPPKLPQNDTKMTTKLHDNDTKHRVKTTPESTKL